MKTKSALDLAADSIVASDSWYQKQTKEWDELGLDGWQFERPPHRLGMVGITIRNYDWIATFYVNAYRDEQTIHTSLLNFCKSFAQQAKQQSFI